jgi:hypothetical protein
LQKNQLGLICFYGLLQKCNQIRKIGWFKPILDQGERTDTGYFVSLNINAETVKPELDAPTILTTLRRFVMTNVNNIDSLVWICDIRLAQTGHFERFFQLKRGNKKSKVWQDGSICVLPKA